MEDAVRKATELILKLMGSGAEKGKASTGQSLEIGKLRMILGELLKSLPANMQSLPKGLRTQLQNILQAPREGLFFDTQGKILQLIKELTGEVQYSLSNNNLKDILIPMEGLDSRNLKNDWRIQVFYWKPSLGPWLKTIIRENRTHLLRTQK